MIQSGLVEYLVWAQAMKDAPLVEQYYRFVFHHMYTDACYWTVSLASCSNLTWEEVDCLLS